MKSLKKYLAWFTGAVFALSGLTACQDDIDAPAIDAPVAKDQPNMTILELKQKYWNDAVNYADTIGLKKDENGNTVTDAEGNPVFDDNEYIIKGRVTSSDEAGNVFKSLVIQDESAAMAISINSYNLYLRYRRGQEIVLNVKGMYIGKYNGLVQLGMPEWYENGNAWEISFMSPEKFNSVAQLNGLPELSKIDTLEINSFAELPTNPEGLCRYQSRLVKFNNIKFTNGGKETFSTYHSSGVNQAIEDVDGASLNVRTSGYANFWNRTLPEERGDLVCILSYYGTTGWQLTMIDYNGCMNFGNPTEASGTKNKPWSVDEAVALQTAGKTPQGWVTGYIVGAVAPEITKVSSNNDIEWSATPILDNTLVIGQTPDTKDIAHCLIIELPAGSKLAQYGNLPDNPGVYGKQIWLYGTMDKVMDSYGITGNSGATDQFSIDGLQPDDGNIPDGDGSEEKPYNPSQVIGFNPSSTTVPVKSGVWVKGYIVGWADMSTEYVINANTARFSVPATMATNILIAPSADVTDVSKCIGIQLPTSIRPGLNLVDNPGNLGKALLIKGDIAKYSGIAGVRNGSEYKLEGEPTPPTPSGDPVTSIDEQFNTTSLPAGWTKKIVSGDKDWYFTTFQENTYAAMTGYKGTNPPFDSWLMTPAIDMSKVANKVFTFDTQVNGYGSTTSKLEVYVMTSNDPSVSTNTKLNPTLATAPSSGYSSWVGSGNIDLSAFNGTIYIGFRYNASSDANYATWCVDNVKLNAGDTPTPPDPPTPPTPSGDYKGDFNTFNGGEAKASPYGEYKNATGWVATNAIILGGGDTDSNPYFTFIGASGTLAPTLNGRPDKIGTLTSPLLSGSIKMLTFNYGFAFTEKKAGFTVNIKDASGNVIKTQSVKVDTIEKLKAYGFSMEVNYTGNFTIEIVNDCYSGTENKNTDRISFWNLTWTE
ncbi:MAG: choice-of-anchor J domain-containing protein [Muribaculaceae bacterium]|nr:choice-of-anchor J domain-containing protein [Muribaculaceae bacterium]